MLAQIFTWWWRQIVSLVPARLRRHGLEDAVIVAVDQWDAESGRLGGDILVRRGGEERFAAALQVAGAAVPNPAPRLATALRLPDSMVLHRDITLPLAEVRVPGDKGSEPSD